MLEKEVRAVYPQLDAVSPCPLLTRIDWLHLAALTDEQRHHVCEDPRSLGRALQIRRADEHPHAFPVTRQVKLAVCASIDGALMALPFSLKEKMLLYRLEEQNLGQVSSLEFLCYFCLQPGCCSLPAGTSR